MNCAVEGVEISRAGVEEVDGLRGLYLDLHAHHRRVSSLPLVADDEASWRGRRARYLEWLREDGRAFLHVARRDRRPLGYAMTVLQDGPDETFAFAGGHAEVYTLAVAPAERGRGIGGALLDAVDADLAAVGVHDLAIAVMAGNDDALRFYERRGLVPGETVLYRVGAQRPTTAT
jgi:ribosomal protein S18 acetylase RimI-like enzyme